MTCKATPGRFIVALVVLLLGCGADDDDTRFACGNHGGTCDRDTEVCIIGGDDMCSTCVPRPATCDADATCECLPPGPDPVYGNFNCVDAGTCAEVDGGLALTCSEVVWGCG